MLPSDRRQICFIFYTEQLHCKQLFTKINPYIVPCRLIFHVVVQEMCVTCRFVTFPLSLLVGWADFSWYDVRGALCALSQSDVSSCSSSTACSLTDTEGETLQLHPPPPPSGTFFYFLCYSRWILVTEEVPALLQRSWQGKGKLQAAMLILGAKKSAVQDDNHNRHCSGNDSIA